MLEVFLEFVAKRLLPHLVPFDSRTHIVWSSWAVVSFTVDEVVTRVSVWMWMSVWGVRCVRG